MQRAIKVLLLSIAVLVSSTTPIKAQEVETKISQAKVKQILSTDQTQAGTPYQTLLLVFTNGEYAGQEITIEHGKLVTLTPSQLVTLDQKVVVQTVTDFTGTQHWIIDTYRLTPILWIVGAFCILVIIIAGIKGIGSLVGMFISLMIITQFIVPQILNGQNPLMISLIGSLIILTVTLYLAHGPTKQTTIALISTLVSLLITGIISILFVEIAQLTGLGSEDAYTLQLGPTKIINLKGLLLGSMIIGAIGVLDDITTGQVAAVYELKRANPKFKFPDLFSRARKIGTEHIASLVNTLVMAYAGAAMPLFIFFILNPSGDPLWAILNSELIAEEVIRTVAGSTGLILAVPITTFIAAAYLNNKEVKDVSHTGHSHTH